MIIVLVEIVSDTVLCVNSVITIIRLEQYQAFKYDLINLSFNLVKNN